MAGDTCTLLKVRTEDSRALESLLARIYDTPVVIRTRSHVVLSTHLERVAETNFWRPRPPALSPVEGPALSPVEGPALGAARAASRASIPNWNCSCRTAG